MSEFSSQSPVEIARRLEIRGEHAWLAVLIPSTNPESALDGLRAELSSLLRGSSRVLSLRQSSFEQLREALHHPDDDIVILSATPELEPDKWSSLDLMRSALERTGPVILWLPADAVPGLSKFAPNIRNFIGPSIFNAGPDGGIMSERERQKRIGELVQHYGLSNEEIVRRAESGTLPPEPHYIEWLVLLRRGDLV